MTMWNCFFLWLKAVWTVKSPQLRWKNKMGILQELSTFDGDVEGCSSTGSWVFSHSETFWVGLCVGYIYPSLCYRICPFSSWFLFTTWKSQNLCCTNNWQLTIQHLLRTCGHCQGCWSTTRGLKHCYWFGTGCWCTTGLTHRYRQGNFADPQVSLFCKLIFVVMCTLTRAWVGVTIVYQGS